MDQSIISLNQPQQQIVSITDFRRNAGAYLDRSMPLTIVRGSKVIGHFIPVKKSTNLQEDLKKIEKLAGGFHFKVHLTPKQMNEEYDKMYDEMLPR